MTDFKIGDVVSLKHGGPRMTIGAVNAYGKWEEIETLWFDNEFTLHRNVFNREAIELASEKTPAPTAVDNSALPF